MSVKTRSAIGLAWALALLTAGLGVVHARATDRTLLSDPGVTLARIESEDGSLPTSQPAGFTFEPISPVFYQRINNITFYEFNGTYYEELNGTFVPAIEVEANGTFTLLPKSSIESAADDGALIVSLGVITSLTI